jgi:hypothetical protein
MLRKEEQRKKEKKIDTPELGRSALYIPSTCKQSGVKKQNKRCSA